MTNEGGVPWDNPEAQPPVKGKGGFIGWVVGKLRPSDTSQEHLEQLRQMRGVDTELTEEEGKPVVKVTVNTMITPEKKKK